MIKSVEQVILSSLLLWSSLASAICFTETEIPSSTPSNRFADQGDGTIVDSKTGLMWAKCAVGQDPSSCMGSAASLTWQGALQAAENNTLASYTDWRLPNVKELRSIVEQRCYNPSINLDVFPGALATEFWSASPAISDPNNAWLVEFRYGENNSWSNSFGRGGSFHVRLVRPGW